MFIPWEMAQGKRGQGRLLTKDVRVKEARTARLFIPWKMAQGKRGQGRLLTKVVRVKEARTARDWRNEG